MVKKKKKDVVLVFGITKDYVFALANTLIGLKKHNKKFWDDIIVYHDGLGERERKCICKIMPVIFVDLSGVQHFQEIAKSNIETIEKYSVATFYRYECLNLLEEYRQVIWNDVDILIQGDISGLLEYGQRTGVAFSMAMSDFVVGSSLKKLINNYKVFAPLWNVGIMVLTDKLLDYKKIYDWCIESTVELEKVLLWPDLAILNLMLQRFGIDPENIDADKYVCLPLASKTKDAAIVHAYGDKKFWNNLRIMQSYPEWMDNAIEWSKIAYDAKKAPIVSCVMSCYERYDFLVEAVRSVLAQSFVNFELVVVLEKSGVQKEIEKVLREFNDERIVIINNKEKLGFAASLNVGIDAARGEYIARMDDDDISVPCRFAKEVDYLKKHEEIGIVGSDMVVFGRENGYAPAFRSSELIKAATLVESPFKHPTVMMRLALLNENNLRYDPGYFAEDYELWSRLIYYTKGANIPEALVCYRSHNAQATSSSTSTNELKIHSSHKRTMVNQLKEHLDLDFSDNEIELLQTRKSYWHCGMDIDGMMSLRDEAIKKILEANDRNRVYDDKALDYILNYRKPGEYREIEADEVLVESEEVVVRKGPKKVIKKVIRKLTWPVYARLVDRMEAIMINHDNWLQAELQWQIDDMRRRSKM